VLPASRDAILARLDDGALVLDAGGWAKPFARADWVIDLQPYDTRGLYGYDEGQRATERFTADTWVVRDLCATEPWPFADEQFDFAICSHTLEDVRDPVRVCEELTRVAKAGYVEVPSRAEEQMWGVQGEWVGWGHHHWLCDVSDGGIDFVFKHHILHAREDLRVPHRALTPEERVSTLWWEGTFAFRERVFVDGDELEGWLREVVPTPPRRGWHARRR
jgi:Methyltransferase domain